MRDRYDEYGLRWIRKNYYTLSDKTGSSEERATRALGILNNMHAIEIDVCSCTCPYSFDIIGRIHSEQLARYWKPKYETTHPPNLPFEQLATHTIFIHVCRVSKWAKEHNQKEWQVEQSEVGAYLGLGKENEKSNQS